MKKASLVSAAIVAAVGSVLGGLAACGTTNALPGAPGSGDDGGGGERDGGTIPHLIFQGEGGSSGGEEGGVPGQCSGLQCQIHTCTGDAAANGTTISGKVYDPALNNPLYGVVVYVPNSQVQPLPAAPQDECASCGTLFTGDPIAAGITDADGKFTIPNAPDGANIPIVIQIGKWRKQTSIASVTPCQDNPQADKSLSLPSQADAKDDLPQIAISTGGADSLECLLRRIGVDKSEYTSGPGGTGHIHIFQGSPVPGNQLPNPAIDAPTTPSALAGLWDKASDLSPYDILILSCEGEETIGTAGGVAGSLTATELSALESFTSAGGRAFLSHFHYAWLDQGPFSQANPPLATWTVGANPIEDQGTADQTIYGNIVTTLSGGAPFVKGEAFNTWLGNTGALINGQLPIAQPKHNADVSAADTPSQTWITADQNAVAEDNLGNATTTSVAGATEYFTFDTPLDPTEKDDAGSPVYCGRVVYSDLHVGAASGDYPNAQTGGAQPITPAGCANNPLSPQEKALEFMLFDLSSCVTPDKGPGSGPPPVPVPIK